MSEKPLPNLGRKYRQSLGELRVEAQRRVERKLSPEDLVRERNEAFIRERTQLFPTARVFINPLEGGILDAEDQFRRRAFFRSAKVLPAWVKLPPNRLKQQYLLSTGENMFGADVDFSVIMRGEKEEVDYIRFADREFYLSIGFQNKRPEDVIWYRSYKLPLLMMTNTEFAIVRFVVGENLNRTVVRLPQEGIREFLHHKKPLFDIS